MRSERDEARQQRKRGQQEGRGKVRGEREGTCRNKREFVVILGASGCSIACWHFCSSVLGPIAVDSEYLHRVHSDLSTHLEIGSIEEATSGRTRGANTM